MPVAGRSRMPSWHPLSACPLRFAILAALAPIARLSGTGSPSQHHRSHVNPEGRARVRMAAPPRPNRMREITERGAAHAPGAGVCRQAKPGWRSAGDIRVSRGLEGNPVRHGRCRTGRPTSGLALGCPRRCRLATCTSIPRRLGATHALSLDVRLGPPGLDSLHVRCASPGTDPPQADWSWLRLLP